MSPSIYGCSSTFGDLISLSFLIFCLCFLICLSYGVDICDASTFYLPTCTNVGIANGATFLLIIFWAFASMLSCSFLAPTPEVPPSSTLFFLFRAPLRNFVAIFLLFSNVIYISSLVLLTLVCGFYGLFFCGNNIYLKIFARIMVDWHVSFLSPLFSLTYLYDRSNLLHKLLNIICTQSTFFLFFVLISVMTFLFLK